MLFQRAKIPARTRESSEDCLFAERLVTDGPSERLYEKVIQVVARVAVADHEQFCWRFRRKIQFSSDSLKGGGVSEIYAPPFLELKFLIIPKIKIPKTIFIVYVFL
jgi:hypothetical protein